MASALNVDMWQGGITTKGLAEGKLCAYAEKCPHIKNTKDQSVNNKRARARTCIMKAIHHMLTHPSTAEDIWTSIESGLACESIEEVQHKEQSDDSPGKLCP